MQFQICVAKASTHCSHYSTVGSQGWGSAGHSFVAKNRSLSVLGHNTTQASVGVSGSVNTLSESDKVMKVNCDKVVLVVLIIITVIITVRSGHT